MRGVEARPQGFHQAAHHRAPRVPRRLGPPRHRRRVHVHLRRSHPRAGHRVLPQRRAPLRRVRRHEAPHDLAHRHRSLRLHRHGHRLGVPERSPLGRHRLPAHRRLRHRARGLHRAPVRGLLLALRQAQPQRGALRRRRRYPPPRHPRGVPAQGRLAPPPLCQEGVLRLRCPRGDHDHREGWIRRYPLPHLVRCSRRRAVEPRFLRPGEVRGLHRRRLARVAAVLPRHVPPRLRHREGEGLAPLRLRRVVHALQQEDQQ